MDPSEEIDIPLSLSPRRTESDCEICGSCPSKYTCPRCSVKTCCLSCVKKHKAQSQCSGVRDKTAFVAIKEFTEKNLLSDYRFLEDADRKRYTAINDPKKNRGYLNFRWKAVSKRSREMGVDLRLLPHYFSRHRENTTNYIKKFKRLAWHVKWMFPQAEAEFTEKRLSEDTILREALDNYLSPQKADPVVRQRLKAYCSQGTDQIKVFMKEENCPANCSRFHCLDLNTSLADNLKGKTVVEYPTMHVVLQQHASKYLQHDHDDDCAAAETTEGSTDPATAANQRVEEGAEESCCQTPAVLTES